jgi:prevent-host-death family protein
MSEARQLELAEATAHGWRSGRSATASDACGATLATRGTLAANGIHLQDRRAVGNITTFSRHGFVRQIMDQSVSAADANREFSLLLRGVREGKSYLVTSHGKPVARIVPVAGQETITEGARAALLSRLEAQDAVEAGQWTRDELYEDEA